MEASERLRQEEFRIECGEEVSSILGEHEASSLIVNNFFLSYFCCIKMEPEEANIVIVNAAVRRPFITRCSFAFEETETLFCFQNHTLFMSVAQFISRKIPSSLKGKIGTLYLGSFEF